MSETETTHTADPSDRPRTAAQAAEAGEKRGRGGGKGGSVADPDAWMVTFSDLLTLLMTFFVLIFASQDPVPPEKLQEAFGQDAGVFGMFRTSFLQRIAAVPRRDISQDLVQVFLDEIGANDVQVEQEERGLVITLPTDTFFAPGSTRLNARAVNRIGQLAALLKVTAHDIRVEGHTDNREPVGRPYRSHWELSLARANRVLERLIRLDVDEERLSLVGYGPSHPKFTNRSRLGRSRNRRVEIVIVNRARLP